MPDTPVTGQHTNRLINETSPYLLQHADNPVDWYPWGTEAFERAKKEDKPIFLSIGYSTCHWCHVMEHESFENDRIAKILNDNFISIKVDREQRPDVDGIYMRAVQAMTGSGGWPLSVFLTPTGQPFYGGTYFPPEDRYGRPGFDRVLLNIAKAWGDRRGELVGAAERLSEMLAASADFGKEKQLSPAMLEQAFKYSLDTFDAANGGFGAAPKFPQPTNFLMLLCYWYRTGDDRALQMVEKTLDSMGKGGIYDHVGGGFHRYSTDDRWLVPHFEKMLYDQALISRVYLQAYQITNKRQYARIATEIFDYVLRDMTDDAGGFYSAEDADSEGEEGTFYVWGTNQIASILDDEHADVFNAYYGVTKKGNFEHGKSILNVAASMEQLEKKFGIDSATVEKILASARSEVFKQREKRIRPHRDDKVIAGWNGLMISSLAYGGAVLGQDRFTAAAERAAEFVLGNMHEDKRLRRYYRSGSAVGYAFVDDYAFMILALLDLYHASFNPKWLIEANQLAEEMIELFADDKEGGFFFAGKDGEKLIARSKPYIDTAIPAGNSAAGLALLKLGRLTINEDFTKQGFGVLEAFSNQLEQTPAYAPTMLVTLNFWLGPAQEVVLAGDLKAEDTKEMLKLIRGQFLPNAVFLFHPQGPGGSAIENIAAFIKNQTPIDGKATVYLCENYACKAPVNDPAVLSKMLSGISGAK